METFQTLLENFKNPAFLAVFCIGLILIWLKHRFIWRATRKVSKDLVHGWSNDAKTLAIKHETGVGTTDVKVMRPPMRMGIPLLTLVFFGGGAYFMTFHATPDAGGELKHWLVVAGMWTFTAMGIVLLMTLTTRVIFDSERVTKRGLLSRSFSGKFSSIERVDPLGRSFATGLRLTFRDGEKISVPANLSGYRQFLEHLGKFDHKFKLMAQMHAIDGGSS